MCHLQRMLSILEEPYLIQMQDSSFFIAVPKEYLLTPSLRPFLCIIKDKLPFVYQNDPEINQYFRCDKHRRLIRGSDAYDGPPPYVRDCRYCQIIAEEREYRLRIGQHE